MRVIWDPAKNLANQRKHGISFQEAARLFTSRSNYLVIYDEAHSGDEDRFIAIGPIRRGTVVVAWTEEVEEDVRIISARWATARELRLLRSHLGPRP